MCWVRIFRMALLGGLCACVLLVVAVCILHHALCYAGRVMRGKVLALHISYVYLTRC